MRKFAFELFVASLVKAVDETKKSQEEENDNLIAIWNEKLRRYINEQQNFAKNRRWRNGITILTRNT